MQLLLCFAKAPAQLYQQLDSYIWRFAQRGAEIPDRNQQAARRLKRSHCGRAGQIIEQRHFAKDFSGAEGGNLLRGLALRDAYLPFHQNEKASAGFAFFHQDGAGGILPLGASFGKQLQFLCVKALKEFDLFELVFVHMRFIKGHVIPAF